MQFRNFILVFLLTLLAKDCFCQDVHFSQNTRTPLLTNPALAGPDETKRRFIMNYRDQWKEISNSYRTMAASFDTRFLSNKFNNGFLGIGLDVCKDVAGDLEMGMTKADVSIAYHSFLTRELTFAAGIQGGFVQENINESKMQWGNQFNGSTYDPTYNSNEHVLKSVTFGDVAGGLSWTYIKPQKFTGLIGLSVFHINKPNQSMLLNREDRLKRKLVIHGNSIIPMRDTHYALAPDFSITVQNTSTKILCGMLMKVSLREAAMFTGWIKETLFWYGAHYRVGDALIFSVGIDKLNYSFGFSYDATVSSLNAANHAKGGMEVSLKIISMKSFYYKKARK